MGAGQIHKALGALGFVSPTLEFDEAIRLNPQGADAYYNRGQAYDYLGQYERAIQDYDEAIRLDPQLAIAYNNRGYAYRSHGKTKEAELDYQKAKERGYEL
jgi:tetratricopeptide (TPR) repeat protein